MLHTDLSMCLSRLSTEPNGAVHLAPCHQPAPNFGLETHKLGSASADTVEQVTQWPRSAQEQDDAVEGLGITTEQRRQPSRVSLSSR